MKKADQLRKQINTIASGTKLSKIEKLREISKLFYGDYSGKKGSITISRNPDRFGYLRIKGNISGTNINLVNVDPGKALMMIKVLEENMKLKRLIKEETDVDQKLDIKRAFDRSGFKGVKLVDINDDQSHPHAVTVKYYSHSGVFSIESLVNLQKATRQADYYITGFYPLQAQLIFYLKHM